ncbi:MAG: tetratricopeptide repeat protein [Armatimonadetes bacterium]|nr:tetratricopeptide repeat protein [Armatimonadota bacterium]
MMATKPLFCDDCGAHNTPDSKYCKACGAKIHVLQMLTLSNDDQVEDPVQQERLTQFLDMAFWHTEAGNLDAAVRACQSALAINPSSTTAHSLLGSLYEKKGQDSLAIEHFERVLALNPDSEADRAKLEQLREGIHAEPVRPSPVYRWLPPVLARLRFADLAGERRGPDFTVLPAKPTPALAAGAAAILVLAAGLFTVRPAPRAGAPSPHPTSVAPRVLGRSAFGAAPAAMSEPSAGPAPVVLMPPPVVAPPPVRIAAAPGPNPFSGPPRAAREVTPLIPITPAHRRARPASAHRAGRGGLHALPPLTLVAVPPADHGPLPPAPVKVPASLRAASASPYAGVARHTVVVQRLNGTPSEFSQMGAAVIASGDNGDSAAPAPQPHIEITIDRGSDGGSGGSREDNTPAGETYQQTAFSLQQQGDYRRARATYEKAVHAYQAQIAAGRDPEAARRGLEACKTGLQICQQGQ